MLPTLLKGATRMRGPDEQTNDMFSYLSPEAAGPAGSPVARDPPDDGRRAPGAVAPLHEDVLGHRPAVDSARAVAPRVAAAGPLHDSQRAAADGGDRLQHVVSLVHRPQHGRADLVADDLQQEPRPAAEGRRRQRVLRRRGPPGARGRPDVRRALHRGRDRARGVGESEEFSAQGRRPDAAAR